VQGIFSLKAGREFVLLLEVRNLKDYRISEELIDKHIYEIKYQNNTRARTRK